MKKSSANIIVNARFLNRRVTGLERFALNIAPHLRTLLENGEFICHKDILHKASAEKLDARQVGKLNGHLWEQLELSLLLNKSGKPLLLNLTNTGPVTYANQVVVIHDVAFLRNPGWFSKSAATYFSWLVGKVAKKARHIITVSDFSKFEIIELLGIPPEKITVVYEAPDPVFASFTGKEFENPYGKYLLTVSSLNPRKNLKALIEAFLKAELEDTKLVLAGGTDSLVYGMKDLGVEPDDRIIATGYVSDEELAGLYLNAQAFVYPSIYEGFGLPPMEAMLFGSPLLLAEASCLPEVFGDAAYYFDPSNEEHLIDRLREMAALEGNPKQKNFRGILERQTWERAAQQIHTVLGALR